jgi:hypothetical protein
MEIRILSSYKYEQNILLGQRLILEFDSWAVQKMRLTDKVSVRSPKPRRVGSIPTGRANTLTMKKKFDAH